MKRPEALGARIVFIKEREELRPEKTEEEPALKRSHPYQRMRVPKTT